LYLLHNVIANVFFGFSIGNYFTKKGSAEWNAAETERLKNYTIELENLAENVHSPNVATPDDLMKERKDFLFSNPSKNPTGGL
jgi:hypothetical protein